MFAPFWLLGIAAVVGCVWHVVHYVIVHARAQAAGHVPKGSVLSVRPRHELTPAMRHHLRWAMIAVGALIGLCVGGLLVGFFAGLVARV